MRAFAEELATLKPDCIVGQSTPVIEALLRVTRTIPIVFVAVTDPIGSGFVSSIARPGGNVTGFTVFQGKMTGKYLSILRQLSSAAIIYNPTTAPGANAAFGEIRDDVAPRLGRPRRFLADFLGGTAFGGAICRARGGSAM